MLIAALMLIFVGLVGLAIFLVQLHDTREQAKRRAALDRLQEQKQQELIAEVRYSSKQHEPDSGV